jgi:hypothetical protein
MATTQVSEYVQQADKLLEEMSVSFHVTLIGSDCPKFCEDARKGIGMSDVDRYPRKTHIHGKHYRCTFARRVKVSEADGKPVWSEKHVGADFVVDFWNSYADEEENFFAFSSHVSLNNWVTGRDNVYWDKYRIGGKYNGAPRLKKRCTPSAYDVLACIQKSDVGTFEDFCGDFGYDSDSRTAERTYQAVVEEWRKVRAFFTADEIEKLQEVN